MAASSSSSKYDVFLSFRGTDTRLNFTDHLYTALVEAGIETFRDDNNLPRGENINQELLNAIHDSVCSVIVFSKDYASSKACLYELVTILEYRKTSSNHIVIPVFYDVTPDDVGKQTGSFFKAFSDHEKQFKKDINKVNRWREALKEASHLAGMNLGNKPEAKFIKEIVNEVEMKLPMPLNVTPHLVGRDSLLEYYNPLTRDGSSAAKMLFIYGPLGIGKSTIAKCIFNSNFRRFDRSAFLENFSATSRLPGGESIIKRKLVSSLTKRGVKIPDDSEAQWELICAILLSKKVLLVVDGVEEAADDDDHDLLKLIIALNTLLFPGGTTIVTMRHHPLTLTKWIPTFMETKLLQKFVEKDFRYEIFGVGQLDTRSSLQLFCQHAFAQDYPEEGHEQLSERIVEQCEGNPLALEMAASLDWTSRVVIEEAVELSKYIPQFWKQNSISQDHRMAGYKELGKKFVKKLHQDLLDIWNEF